MTACPRLDEYPDTASAYESGRERALDLAPGQVQYHLRQLSEGGSIDAESVYGRTHYYPPGYDAFDRAAVALIRRETTREVLVTLIEDGPLGPAAVADEGGIARSTLEHHVDNLGEVGLVEKRRDAHNRVTLVLAAPERTGELLSDVTGIAEERLRRWHREASEQAD